MLTVLNGSVPKNGARACNGFYQLHRIGSTCGSMATVVIRGRSAMGREGGGISGGGTREGKSRCRPPPPHQAGLALPLAALSPRPATHPGLEPRWRALALGGGAPSGPGWVPLARGGRPGGPRHCQTWGPRVQLQYEIWEPGRRRAPRELSGCA